MQLQQGSIGYIPQGSFPEAKLGTWACRQDSLHGHFKASLLRASGAGTSGGCITVCIT